MLNITILPIYAFSNLSIGQNVELSGKITLEPKERDDDDDDSEDDNDLKALAQAEPYMTTPGNIVLLDGDDSEGDIEQFEWNQIIENENDLQVDLRNGNKKVATFIAPSVQERTKLVFELAVKNDNDEVTDKVEITVIPEDNGKSNNTNISNNTHNLQVPIFYPFDTKEVETDPGGEKIENQYIVNIDTMKLGNNLIINNTINSIIEIVKGLGGNVISVYEDAITGISFNTQDDQASDNIIEEIKLIDDNISIEQDVTVVPFADQIPLSLQRIDSTHLLSNDTVSYGTGNFDIDIAIIDSGIDLDHPDLNVYKIISTIRYTNTPINDDLCGHGTHVAGIIGAKDDNKGIVGIVPDARLWSVKAMDINPETGKCHGSVTSLISAIEYLIKNSAEIEIANLSLGCKCNSTSLDNAISRAINSNITIVVAAGNLNTYVSSFSPANHPDVITVSSITDFDGRCGAKHPSENYIPAGNFQGFYLDDTFSRFSNYGPEVTIAAPGVLINSTYINGTYFLLSGTSMAAPHVTGTAALYKILNPNADPLEIKNKLIDVGTDSTIECNDVNNEGYFKEDFDNAQENLLHMTEISTVFFNFYQNGNILNDNQNQQNEFDFKKPSSTTKYDFLKKIGKEGSNNGAFSGPADVSIDNINQVIYVSEIDNNRIQKFTTEGDLIMTWGQLGDGDGEFDGAGDVTIDTDNQIAYVSETHNHRIQKFTTEGEFIMKWGKFGVGDGEFDKPGDIAIDPKNNMLYITDIGNHRIQKFTTEGEFIMTWGELGDGDGEFNRPAGLDFDPINELIYVADTNNNRIQVFDINGEFITKWGSEGDGDGQFDDLTSVTVDDSGDIIYVADTNNNRIQVFDINGEFITKWGSEVDGDEDLSRPVGLVIDSNYDVYVLDKTNNMIKIFRPVY